MRILGIDPGLTRCGIGFIDIASNRKLSLVHVNVIRTEPSLELPHRLHKLHHELGILIETFKPDQIAIERVFSQQNVTTAMGTAQASALAMLLAAQQNLPVFMYTPTEVKAAVSGSGKANKQQVTTMVTRLLNLEVAPKPADAADALALAMCHAWKGPNQNLITQALVKHNSRTKLVAS